MDRDAERSMVNQKAENLLNLALEATPREREESIDLETGYDSAENRWELIVKYSGTSERIREISDGVSELLNGYAVIWIQENRIPELEQLAEVEYIEKPKSLYFETLFSERQLFRGQDILSPGEAVYAAGRRVSCIDEVQELPLLLSGKDVLVGIVDSGIDCANRNFRKEDGTTRIVALWDQTVAGQPPEGYFTGAEYTAEMIDEAIRKREAGDLSVRLPGEDFSGHGTAVAGIAVGNGEGSPAGLLRGAAPEADLIVVKMGNPKPGGFPRTTELMQGVDYIVRKAQELGKPAAVNISFGNTYGSHDGTSLMERFLDDISEVWKTVICAGSGNEGNSAGHASGTMQDDEETVVEIGVQEREPSLNVQIWKSYVDEADIIVSDPAGRNTGPIQREQGAQRIFLGRTELLIYYGEPRPYSVRQEVYIAFLPRESYIDSGVWRVTLVPRQITDGRWEMWLPAQGALNEGTAFLRPDSSTTLTIPSTAALVVTVAAYDARTFSYADFSGRGPAGAYEGESGPKPDLAAPGVQEAAPLPGGGYGLFSGTSFAAPFVTGSAALLMEWGIVRGNDPYLYGEKIKAYLRKGAQKLPGYEPWPNAKLGYGILCVRKSLPE